jgi:hypothetical protein
MADGLNLPFLAVPRKLIDQHLHGIRMASDRHGPSITLFGYRIGARDDAAGKPDSLELSRSQAGRWRTSAKERPFTLDDPAFNARIAPASLVIWRLDAASGPTGERISVLSHCEDDSRQLYLHWL